MPTKVQGGKFTIIKKIGEGCFGEVYRGRNTETDQEVAIKFEHSSLAVPQLEHEKKILELVRTPSPQQGFAEQFFYGQEDVYRILVMEYLGKTLESQLRSCGTTFNAKTSILIAEQLVTRIEYLHSKGIIHRDIKSENFVMGVRQKAHHLYVIDFGLSKMYWQGGKHHEMGKRQSLTGTARYASINAHLGYEQSRRDDLEAIGHMLLYFLRGSLPWSGLEARNKEEKYRKIRETKESTPLEELCKDPKTLSPFPSCFLSFLNTARNMEFKQRPDYAGFRKMFEAERKKLGPPEVEDHHFQWNDGKSLTSLVPLVPPGIVLQPDDEPAAGAQRRKSGWCLCGRSKVMDD